MLPSRSTPREISCQKGDVSDHARLSNRHALERLRNRERLGGDAKVQAMRGPGYEHSARLVSALRARSPHDQESNAQRGAQNEAERSRGQRCVEHFLGEESRTLGQEQMAEQRGDDAEPRQDYAHAHAAEADPNVAMRRLGAPRQAREKRAREQNDDRPAADLQMIEPVAEHEVMLLVDFFMLKRTGHTVVDVKPVRQGTGRDAVERVPWMI